MTDFSEATATGSRWMWRTSAAAVAGLALTAGTAVAVGPSAAGAATPGPTSSGPGPIRHVLLVSVDGMHQSDLDWYVRTHPRSALAALTRGGSEYRNARTPFPSDSFPGMVGQVTGGNPASTGIYYDDTYNRMVLPAGTTTCAGAKPGTEVAFTEDADKDPSRLDAGQGLPGLPDSILGMTGNPRSLLDPKALPVDPATCKPVYPHTYLKVNTVFEVAKAHGLRTAWSDKHPAYEILSGPSGTGLDDLFTPEINSTAPDADDWTKDNADTRRYDGYKVRAVQNEIDGFDHSRAHRVGVPAIFGLNFQSVSTAQKLPTSDGEPGGYLSGGSVPGPLVRRSLDFVDRSVGGLVAEIYSQHLAGSTAIVLSAKHGQSPTDPNELKRLDDGPVIDGLNAAWKQHSGGTDDLVAFSTDDDVLQLWLSDRSRAAADFARTYLLDHTASGTDVSGAPTTAGHSGLQSVYAGPAAAEFVHVPVGDARHPDVIGIVQHGIVYTGSTSKIAEHGGNDRQDRDVPLLVVGPGVHPHSSDQLVETTQIAPSILRLLGLDPSALQAVRKEHTGVLPGL